MKDLGYDTFNSILNMGGLSIFVLVYYFRVAYFVVALIVCCVTGRYKGHVRNLKNSLLFNSILGLGIDGFYEFLISGVLNIKEPNFEYNGEVLSILLSWTVMLICAFLLITILFMLCHKADHLNQESTQNWYGAVYENIKLNSKF
jgi:CDP-diglyceride synthetase